VEVISDGTFGDETEGFDVIKEVLSLGRQTFCAVETSILRVQFFHGEIQNEIELLTNFRQTDD
jgi:hypothetical protein